jgi:hypothetical protein
MAHTPATLESFYQRFPEFAGQDDAATIALSDALRGVDTSWTEGDYTIAHALLAAHYLTAGEIASSGKEIASESIGPLSVSYFKSDAGWIATSGYGQRYLMLLRQNRGGARMTGIVPSLGD